MARQLGQLGFELKLYDSYWRSLNSGTRNYPQADGLMIPAQL